LVSVTGQVANLTFERKSRVGGPDRGLIEPSSPFPFSLFSSSEVCPLKPAKVLGSEVSFPAGSGTKPQPKSNFPVEISHYTWGEVTSLNWQYYTAAILEVRSMWTKNILKYGHPVATLNFYPQKVGPVLPVAAIDQTFTNRRLYSYSAIGW